MSGVVKFVSTEGEGSRARNKCLFLLYLSANAVSKPSSRYSPLSGVHG